MITETLRHPASYRDPAGFVFLQDNILYRQVNKSYASDYELLMQSGLYEALSAKGMLITHNEVTHPIATPENHYKTLRPANVPFISYPYEWCFAQLKDAALLTLRINKMAIAHGAILKDATPFNIQFDKGKPIFIDTLSFTKHDVTQPWIAYRQFCAMFLYPLLLGQYHNENFQQLMLARPEGFSAAFTASLLPRRTRWRLATWMHVHLPAKMSKKETGTKTPAGNFSKQKMLQLLDNLESIVQKLERGAMQGVWSNYYTETILGPEYLAEKEKVFRTLLQNISYTTALDLGANDGYFSKIAAQQQACRVTATDMDESCIQRLYHGCKQEQITNILPLVLDLAQPSPAIGVNNRERDPFIERGSSDLVIALALVHHLFYSANIPFADIAALFASLSRHYLVVEFVPESDEKTQELKRHKPGFDRAYDDALFEAALTAHFRILQRRPLSCGRILYLMQSL